MLSYPVVKHKSLIVVQVPLTADEIEECLRMGQKRTELDEEKLGWKYRHHGLKSELAHAIGFMGEKAFEKWLDSKRLKRDIDYVVGERFVERHEEVRQDYVIWGKEIGVKSAKNRSLDEAISFGTFLYPAKKHPDESKRLLGYPEYLVQTVVDIDGKRCWLCGYVDRDAIVASPIRSVVGKPAHLIQVAQYRSVEELLQILKSCKQLDS